MWKERLCLFKSSPFSNFSMKQLSLSLKLAFEKHRQCYRKVAYLHLDSKVQTGAHTVCSPPSDSGCLKSSCVVLQHLTWPLLFHNLSSFFHFFHNIQQVVCQHKSNNNRRPWHCGQFSPGQYGTEVLKYTTIRSFNSSHPHHRSVYFSYGNPNCTSSPISI